MKTGSEITALLNEVESKRTEQGKLLGELRRRLLLNSVLPERYQDGKIVTQLVGTCMQRDAFGRIDEKKTRQRMRLEVYRVDDTTGEKVDMQELPCVMLPDEMWSEIFAGIRPLGQVPSLARHP